MAQVWGYCSMLFILVAGACTTSPVSQPVSPYSETRSKFKPSPELQSDNGSVVEDNRSEVEVWEDCIDRGYFIYAEYEDLYTDRIYDDAATYRDINIDEWVTCWGLDEIYYSPPAIPINQISSAPIYTGRQLQHQTDDQANYSTGRTPTSNKEDSLLNIARDDFIRKEKIGIKLYEKSRKRETEDNTQNILNGLENTKSVTRPSPPTERTPLPTATFKEVVKEYERREKIKEVDREIDKAMDADPEIF